MGKDNWKTFNAHIDKDGNVKGQFQNQGGNYGTWHGDVTDLIVVDNTAFIEYYITFAPDNPSILGKTYCVMVIDNGEGMKQSLTKSPQDINPKGLVVLILQPSS